MSGRDVGFWNLLFPDFGSLLHLLDSPIEAITPILWFVIVGLSVWAWCTSAHAANQARKQVVEAQSLIRDVTTETFWDQRHVVRKRADKTSDEVRTAWLEYDNTLVSNGRQVSGSLPAEVFFNTPRFASALFENRFLHLAPTALTTLGLLGTFLGLTVGLRGLNLGSTPDELRAGIQTLVHGAALGFTASLWGVAMSLLINARLRWLERGIAQKVRGLQDRVDRLLPCLSAEQALSDIARDSAESKEALQVLHEKVGGALQETVRQFGTALQESVTDVGTSTGQAVNQAIQDSLAPIMTELATVAANQSAEVFRDVSRQLTASFRDMGDQLARELKDSAASMRQTIDHMGEELARHADEHRSRMDAMQNATLEQSRVMHESSAKTLDDLRHAAGEHLAELRTTTTEQMAELRQAARTQMSAVNQATERQVRMLDESLPKIVQEIDHAADAVAAATSGLENISRNLSLLAADVRGSSLSLVETLSDATAKMGEMADKTADAAAGLSSQQAVMTTLAGDTGKAAHALQEVTGELKSGFQGMRSVQQAFLDDLEGQLKRHSELMAAWLTDYAGQVEQQTSQRMGQWNYQTEVFTSTMLTVSKGLADVIEEFEAIRAIPEQRGGSEGGVLT